MTVILVLTGFVGIGLIGFAVGFRAGGKGAGAEGLILQTTARHGQGISVGVTSLHLLVPLLYIARSLSLRNHLQTFPI